MLQELFQRYLTAQQQFPHKFSDAIAKELGVTPLALAFARLGQGTQLLATPAKHILQAATKLGEVLAITKNDYAIHELQGEYKNVRINGENGIVLNQNGIDLRLFISVWQYSFAIEEHTSHGLLKSLQFFSQQGESLHKIYQLKQTNELEWNKLIETFAQNSPPLPSIPEPLERHHSATPSLPINEALCRDWRAMTDVHQFTSLLKKHNLTRRLAFAQVPPEFAYRVSTQSLPSLLERVQREQNEIMIFVGNAGVIQIFTGKVAQTSLKDPWFNVLNPKFNLHFNASEVAESWLVRKPTRDGWLHALELIGYNEQHLGVIYGRRSEGEPEQLPWREQVTALQPLLNEGARC